MSGTGSWQADFCCGCEDSPLSAAVRAVMLWPWFLPFTYIGSGDTSGVKYRTITVSKWDFNLETLVTASLTCHDLNGSIMADGLTGLVTTRPQDFWPAWPPDVTPTATHLEWSGGDFPPATVDLSTPISLGDIGTSCQGLLDSLDVAGVTLGTEKRVRYNTDTAPDFIFNSASWPVFNYDVIAGGYYWMDVISQAPYNTPLTPFEYTEAMMVTEDMDGVVVGPEAWSMYEQENRWVMRKTFSSPVTAPVCCQDIYTGYEHTGLPAPVCQMIPDDTHGHLLLDRPTLILDTSDNLRQIVRTPYWGKALTGGGCPCA